ncbi:hypothetical protein ACQV5M_15800 [Leptospira sp. SA-E8]|uniref:hypothetical protein n=1 Tax=Leptospira sp. SA-E8 TaxID=3422259 RepID=UPI003EB697BC
MNLIDKVLDRKETKLSVLIISFSLFLISLGTISGTESTSKSFYSTDSLFFANVFSELIKGYEEGNVLGGLKDWTWTPSVYLFPDLFFYFLLRLFAIPIHASLEAVHLGYAILQWTFLFLSWDFLFKRFHPESSNMSFFYRTSIWFVLGGLFIFQNRFLPLFLPGFHTGTWCLLPISWALFIIPQKNKVFYLLEFFLIFIAVLSDPLFLPSFLIPILLYESFTNLKNIFKEPKSFLSYSLKWIPVVLGLFLGIKAYSQLVRNHFVFFPYRYFEKSIFENYKMIFGPSFWKSLIVLFGSLTGMIWALLLICAGAFFILRKFRKEDVEFSNLNLFYIFSGTVLPFFLILIAYLSEDILPEKIPFRYLGILIPSLFGLLCILIRGRILKISTFFLIIYCGISLSSYIIKNRSLKMEYYPEWISCLDDMGRKNHWQRGMGGFWTSAPVRNFSRAGLVSDYYQPDLSIRPWQNTFRWYKLDTNYSFAILDELDRQVLVKTFGAGGHTEECSETKIYVFPTRNEKKMKDFLILKSSEIDVWKKFTGRE